MNSIFILIISQFLLGSLVKGHEGQSQRKVTKYKQLCPKNTDHWKYPDESFHGEDYLRSSSLKNKFSPIRPSIFPNVPPFIHFVRYNETVGEIPEEIRKDLLMRIANTRSSLITKTMEGSGFNLVDNQTEWNYLWDKYMKNGSFYASLKSHHKINQLPGSRQLDRKDLLWKNLQTSMLNFGLAEYYFVPKTFILPRDLELLRTTWRARKCKDTCMWVVKPPNRANGEGIHVISKWSKLPDFKKDNKMVVVQEYIKPLLVNERKFDLRLYVLVTSYEPLRAYLYQDGFVRLAAMKYSNDSKSVTKRTMHLTNHAINRRSKLYVKNNDINGYDGNQWSVKALWRYLEDRGVNTETIRKRIQDVVTKTLISVQSSIAKKQNLVPSRYTGFQFYGFDIGIDDNLKPWLFEVNISPGMGIASGFLQDLKGKLVTEYLNIAGYHYPPFLSEEAKNMLRKKLDHVELESLTFDERIYTNSTSEEEAEKHELFTTIKSDRTQYLMEILQTLTSDDVRQLITAEEELTQCDEFQRIFPTKESHLYLKYFEKPNYYNKLLDAWENKYGGDRTQGKRRLQHLCQIKFHLNVPSHQ